jgi:hypothetical protein
LTLYSNYRATDFLNLNLNLNLNQGLIDFLCGTSGRAKILRNTFVFKIIPMLNPDGVIAGQYRCSLAGCDLNRVWLQPSPCLHPTIHATKTLLKALAAQREVALYCDLHGHSRKCNMFMYGCSPRTPSQALMERVWPYLLHKASPTFEYEDCTFRVEKSKEGSARVVVFKEVPATRSYTLEMSLGGGLFGAKDVAVIPQHFDVGDYVNLGQQMCLTILDMYDPGKVKLNSVLSELSQLHPELKRQAEEWAQRPEGKSTQDAALARKATERHGAGIWQLPDAYPKDTSKVPTAVAVLKLEAGLPKVYKSMTGKAIKAKVSTGAKAVPKKKVKKVVKKAGYG